MMNDRYKRRKSDRNGPMKEAANSGKKNDTPERKIIFCPNCTKPAEARDYVSRNGLSDWRVQAGGVTIACSGCSYSGLPVTLPFSEYQKIRK